MDKIAPPFSYWKSFAVWACAIILLGEANVFARKAEPVVLPKAPPQPIAPLVRVKRGESIEIPFRIYGTRSQTLDYLIRIPPKSGKISEIRRVAQEVAAVTYTPSRELTIKQDKFSYAVRSSEGVSAAVEVSIQILDADPELSAPETIDFGKVLAGETALRSVEIINRGGGIAEGEVEADGPWKIEGSRIYRLAAGSSQAIHVSFTPLSTGPARGSLRYGRATSRTSALQGEGMAVLSFQPSHLQFKQQEAESPIRSAELEIINNSAIEQTVTAIIDPRFSFSMLPPLKPNARERVVIKTLPGDVARLDGELRFASTAGEFSIPIHGDPVAPIIQSERRNVSFGALRKGTSASESLAIKNAGGVGISVTCSIEPPYSLSQTSLLLAPGEHKEIVIAFHAAETGVFHSTLLVRAASSVELRVPVEGHAGPAAGSAPPVVKLHRAAPSTATFRQSTSASEETGAPRQQATIVSLTPTSAVLSWIDPHPGGMRYKAEYRLLSLENQQLKSEWKELGPLTTEFKEGRVVGTLAALEPGTFYALRISTEATSVPKWHAVFTTPQKSRRFTPKLTPLRVLTALLVLTLGGVLWQRASRPRASR